MAPRKTARSSQAKPARATITIEDLSNFEESVNILIHGDSGAGKTVLAGGAPNAVFISPEKGTISAKRFGSKAKLIRTPTWPEFEAGLAYLEEHIEDFDWAIVDSLPKMQRILLEYLLGLEAEVNEGRDIDLPQIQDHQKWQNMFLRFVNRLVDMPINVIFISTSMRIEGEDEEGDPEDIVLPAIQGKAKQGYAVANEVCAVMDSVFYLRRKRRGGKVIRQILTERMPPFFAKDRFDTFGKPWVTLADNDPTVMQRILDKIKESSRSAPPKAKAGDLPDFDDPDLDDVESEDDEEDEPEPAKRPAARKPSRKAAKPTESDEEPEDDEEDEPEPPQRSRGSQARRAPAKRRTPAKKPEPEPDDEDDEDDEEEQAPKRPARKTSSTRRSKKPEPEPEEDEPWGEDDDEDDDDF